MPEDHSELVPLLPIPNRTVKRLSADDSADTRVKVGHSQAIKAENAQSFDWAFFFAFRFHTLYSTVTDFARLRGLSTSVPRAQAVW